MKNYIGISRDHSASMRPLTQQAANDYNSKIEAIKTGTIQNNQDTIVSVVECGTGHTSRVGRAVVNSNVTALIPLTTYEANGNGTPLFDSVGELIEMFESVPDYNDPDVSFLVMAITDGAENASRKYTAASLSRKIAQLISTDRWTFVFRVPRGYARNLTSLGIPAGNILEWDQTERGVVEAAAKDTEAFASYFNMRSSGVRATEKFYTNLTDVSSKQVEATLDDISARVTIWPIGPKEDGMAIKPFVEQRLAGPMTKGCAFYQLNKPESAVQDYKKILIRDKTTQAIYYGAAARQMLGLPTWGTIKLAPGQHGNFDVFVQSTSVNRKLVAGTSLIYWAQANN